ncbi:hypothetical protein [Halalkalibacterium ligniniphilum]|uniref:hypothetical protein n=1 Tax=Halalkalibacterium ligniniphilum TaxID=1134413 RepID=UPI00036EFF31|nr:hypothetical protein [Halalkalibacterium ligniniphilum]
MQVLRKAQTRWVIHSSAGSLPMSSKLSGNHVKAEATSSGLGLTLELDSLDVFYFFIFYEKKADFFSQLSNWTTLQERVRYSQ